MPGYAELIKNIEKIRKLVRDFYVFGFKGKDDFNVSSRSYDNERRRIQSYLQDYVVESYDKNGKTISISSDTVAKTVNPLFKVWQTKSFTKNDIFLHFVLMDVLKGRVLSNTEISDIIAGEYLSLQDAPVQIDNMTIRNKLNEYVSLGIFASEKKGKTLYYSLKDKVIFPSESLLDAMSFYQNILTGGFLLSPYLKDHKSEFIYKNIYFAQTLDDEIAKQLFDAIKSENILTVNCVTRWRKVCAKDVVPLKIVNNLRTGRKYLASYNKRIHKFGTLRIDNIVSVEITGVYREHKKVSDEYEERMKNSFAIMPKSQDINNIKMVLAIDEEKEKYVLERLEREGMHGSIKKLDTNIFEYSILVPDTVEMLPWLRTFIGRILSIEGSETAVIRQFKRDIKSMMVKHRGEADV
ncbi:MAG: WYL domain-containing protein [Eubacteriales bacterium]